MLRLSLLTVLRQANKSSVVSKQFNHQKLGLALTQLHYYNHYQYDYIANNQDNQYKIVTIHINPYRLYVQIITKIIRIKSKMDIQQTTAMIDIVLVLHKLNKAVQRHITS